MQAYFSETFVVYTVTLPHSYDVGIDFISAFILFLNASSLPCSSLPRKTYARTHARTYKLTRSITYTRYAIGA
jgi:hypothetical protein